MDNKIRDDVSHDDIDSLKSSNVDIASIVHDSSGNTLLMHSCYTKSYKCFSYLLRCGVPLHSISRDGMNAMDISVRCRGKQFVLDLIDCGCWFKNKQKLEGSNVKFFKDCVFSHAKKKIQEVAIGLSSMRLSSILLLAIMENILDYPEHTPSLYVQQKITRMVKNYIPSGGE